MPKMYQTYLRLPMLVRLVIILMLILYLSAILAHFLEKETFPTIFEGFYWAVMTAGTVGYGDYTPHSSVVRVLSIFLVFTGGSFLAFTTVHFASAVVKKENRYFEGKNMTKSKNHYIVVGWNERARNTIYALLENNEMNEVVLMDDSLYSNPLYKEGVHFIQGKASEDGSWMKANIQHAQIVLITADANLRESDADMNTILSILTARGLNEKVLIHAEILTSEQSSNAIRAGADHIIQTSNLAANEMVNCLCNKLMQK
ncbi:potassium channel family protein [Fictibacillus phosphorivorans]|uniref:potassium channel family protein n=1 Tax=Fictibacillus phosphorivorans TaxID=1221500 RepID=UPI0020410504|nr:potassium channel protein [Fictibacillus phosphorivorans]MCM3718730.1 potassium channel family protein [Fictibacillus phosphorivorans]MCM3776353.1 potassium channel family protein [Fictibacillus phosphorivorans]